MDIIEKLNKLRLERNMSVYRLAEVSGVNQSTLANTFSRGTVPSVQTLQAVCAAMGITLAQFFSEGEQTMCLTQEEAQFLRNYQKLPPEVKQAVEQLVAASSKQ